jgi:hypothetical protein
MTMFTVSQRHQTVACRQYCWSTPNGPLSAVLHRHLLCPYRNRVPRPGSPVLYNSNIFNHNINKYCWVPCHTILVVPLQTITRVGQSAHSGWTEHTPTFPLIHAYLTVPDHWDRWSMINDHCICPKALRCVTKISVMTDDDWNSNRRTPRYNFFLCYVLVCSMTFYRLKCLYNVDW